MKGLKKLSIGIIFVLISSFSIGCSNIEGKKLELDPKNPVTVKVWHYYNGPQKVAFDSIVDDFNNTVGEEKGIVVEGYSQGAVQDLIKRVADAANKKVGAEEMPDIFAAYPDTAYDVDKLGLVAELNNYIDENEINEYVKGYIQEGYIDDTNKLKIFPIAKSTEVMCINKTDWDKFALAKGVEISELNTIEGLVKVAEKYYKWTDSLTSAANDGKAFFGRDAMANYFIIGCKQLGFEVFNVKNGEAKFNIDKSVVKKLWDNYYIPYINGYFASYGKFSSDDMKTGDIIASVGSVSGVSYLPDKVTINDEKQYPIESMILKAPIFKDGKKVAVQQGAGMVVTKSSEEKEYAAVEFLKWFTSENVNISFAVDSYYLPVKEKANNMNLINENLKDKDSKSENLKKLLPVAVDTVKNYELYNTKAFKGGTNARDVLEGCLINKAKEDKTKIEELLKNGTSKEEAINSVNFNGNFNKWYEDLLDNLNKSIL